LALGLLTINMASLNRPVEGRRQQRTCMNVKFLQQFYDTIGNF